LAKQGIEASVYEKEVRSGEKKEKEVRRERKFLDVFYLNK